MNFRLICATHVDLSKAVREARFREDLLYRIDVFSIKLLGLKSRPDDIIPLANQLLARVAIECGLPADRKLTLSPDACDYLETLDWPGNARQMYNALVKAVVLSGKSTLQRANIADAIRNSPMGNQESTFMDAAFAPGFSLPTLIADIKRHYIERARTQTGGNRTKMAEILGLNNRQTLTNWMKTLD